MRGAGTVVLAMIGAGLAIPMADGASARDLVLCGTEWAPYTTGTRTDGGFLSAIARRALAEAGHAATIRLSPWKRALREAAAGRCDALLGLSWAVARERDFVFSRWSLESPVVLATLNPEMAGGFAGDPADLCPARVGALAGSLLAARLGTVGCLEVVPVCDVRVGVAMLAGGRIDYVAETLSAIRHGLAREHSRLVPMLATLPLSSWTQRDHVAFSRAAPDHEALVLGFDAGIERLRATGELDRLLEPETRGQ